VLGLGSGYVPNLDLRQQLAVPAQQSVVAAQGFCFSLRFTARFISGFVGLRRLCRWFLICSSASGFGARFIHSLGLCCRRPTLQPAAILVCSRAGITTGGFWFPLLGTSFLPQEPCQQEEAGFVLEPPDSRLKFS
jgi:hypothetical protein